MRLATAALAATLLAGCAPEYNWRELRAAEQGYVVLLPGKPASMTRRIVLGDQEVSMTMHGARVGETSFTVAVASLADEAPGTRDRAQDAMRVGMLRNIGGTQRAAAQGTVAVIDATGAAVGRERSLRVEAEGSAQGQPVRMLAGFATRGNRAYQWVVLGPSPDREQARTFLDSFRLLTGGT